MKWKDFLATKALTLCGIGMAAVTLLIFSLMLEMRLGFILFAEATVVACSILWLAIRFLLQKKRQAELLQVISQMPEQYLLGAVLAKPENDSELFYFELMQRVSDDAIARVEQAKRERDDYEALVERALHELKTPLTACSLILDNDGSVPKLRRELKRMDNITQTILYYARLKTPEKDAMIRPASAADIINEAIRDQMPLLTAAHISAEVSGDFTVNTDAKAVIFMIEQLLCNAAKYCPGCHITVTAENGQIVFEDNGIGIPAHELPRITERGFTGTNGRKIGSSTGMGLYLVQELCKNLNISMTAESEPQKYTRFRLCFDALTKL